MAAPYIGQAQRPSVAWFWDSFKQRYSDYVKYSYVETPWTKVEFETKMKELAPHLTPSDMQQVYEFARSECYSKLSQTYTSCNSMIQCEIIALTSLDARIYCIEMIQECINEILTQIKSNLLELDFQYKNYVFLQHQQLFNGGNVRANSVSYSNAGLIGQLPFNSNGLPQPAGILPGQNQGQLPVHTPGKLPVVLPKWQPGGTTNETPCPYEAQGFCRSWTCRPMQKVTWNCPHKHTYEAPIPSDMKQKSVKLVSLVSTSDEYKGIATTFANTWTTAGSIQAKVKSIEKIECPQVQWCFDQRKAAMMSKREKLKPKASGQKEIPMEIKYLYHGTPEVSMMAIFEKGFIVPANYNASQECRPGTSNATSFCKVTCKKCKSTNQEHQWNQCHMFGLGVYLAGNSSKADIYYKPPPGSSDTTTRKIIVVQVLLGNPLKFSTLSNAQEYHDQVLPLPSKGYDSFYVYGTTSTVKSVANDEYIVFNSAQLLPAYVITYDKISKPLNAPNAPAKASSPTTTPQNIPI